MKVCPLCLSEEEKNEACVAHELVDVLKAAGRRNQNAAHDALKSDILIALGPKPGCAVFGNPRGVAIYPGGFRVPYGLCPGASDIIGLVQRENAAALEALHRISMFPEPSDDESCVEHALASVAVFFACEVKTGEGKLTPDQKAFLDMVRGFGGVSGVARSVKDALALYDEARHGKFC